MDEKLTALKLVLNELNVPPTIDTVDDRKRLQKAIYLVQTAGVDLGYRYGWYLMGPYSPGLTRDYYELDEATDEQVTRLELKPAVKKKISDLRGLLSSPSDFPLADEDWLELLSSVHFLVKVSGHGRTEALSVLRREKPHLVDYEPTAAAALKKANLL